MISNSIQSRGRGRVRDRESLYDLIGAIDGEIDVGVVVEGGEGDAERLGLLEGALGGGDADDVGELTGGEEGTDLGDDEGGGGAGAEAEDHAAAHVLHGLLRGELLEVVLRESGGHGLRKDPRGCGGAGAAGAERRREGEGEAAEGGGVAGGGGGGGGGQEEEG